jgi:RND family efflux transporter MFP subunit
VRGRPLRFAAPMLVAACHAPAVDDAEKDTPVTVRCEAPRVGPVDETVALRGRIQPPPGGDLPVASQVAGRLAQVAVREGQAIREGDVVATIDDANTRDALRQADAALAQARAIDANAQVTLDRTRALVQRGIAARQELDDATAKAQEAHANVASVAASADLARRTLGRIVVRSSFAGIVTKVWRGAGALVDGTAATPVVELSATNVLEFVADATGAELSRVHEGNAVRGDLTDGVAFDGAVRACARALDPSTGLGTVRIVPHLSGDVPVGAYGRVVVDVGHRDTVRTLPTTALRGAVADGAQVAVCKDGKAEIRTVRVGWRDETRFEVDDSVKDGERVAVDHVLGLEDGTAIAETP